MELDADVSSLIIRDPLIYGKDKDYLEDNDWNRLQNSSTGQQDNRKIDQLMEATSTIKTQKESTVDLEKKLPKENRKEKRKILPSSDLLGDCEIDPTLKFVQTEAGSSQSSRNGDNTPTDPTDPTTPELTDNDEVFDNELETLGSPSSSQGTFSARGGGQRRQSSREQEENESWRTVQIGDKEHRIDLKVIEPYKRVISHGGYYGDDFNTIIVLTVCYLPDKRRRDYQYVMRNLFLYVISTLELLVMDEYTVVYFHGAAARQKVPSFRWLRQIYETIDRKFKKNLNQLLIVHPTFFLRTIMLMTKQFLSPKFYTKLKYIRSLEELSELIPMNHIYIPKEIWEYNTERTEKISGGEP